LLLVAADAKLERARFTLARDAPDALDAAASLAAHAKEIIDRTKYKRRIPDWHLVMARIATAKADAAAARTHLDAAQKWIDEGWRCHVAEHAEITQLLGNPASSSKPRRGFFSFKWGR